MRMLWWCVRYAAVLAVALDALAVQASGPVEQVVQVAFHPHDPDLIVLRYINKGEGLFFSDDGGLSWRLMCGDFAGAQLPLGADPTDRHWNLTGLAITGDGTLLGSSFDMLWQGDTSGCTWSTRAEYEGTWVTDFAQHPSDPDVLLLSTGTARSMNGILQRSADGSFSPLGAQEEVQVLRLRVAETAGGLRIYESAISGMVEVTIGSMTYNTGRYVIRVSDDGGESFEEFEAGAGTDGLRLVAIDPRDPDRILALRDRAAEPDDLLLSDDRGASFSPYLTLTRLEGIALAPDGRVLIAEGPDDGLPEGSVGLWSAANLSQSPAKVFDEDTFCAAYQPATDTFFACPHKLFGSVDQQTGAFSELFDFRTVSGFIECDGSDVAAMCETQLCAAYCGLSHFAQAPVCEVYDGPYCGPCAASGDAGPGCGGSAGAPAADAGRGPVNDAAVNDAAVTADAGARPPDGTDGDDGCSCRIAGASRSGSGSGRAALALFCALALALTAGFRSRLRSGAGRARTSRPRTPR